MKNTLTISNSKRIAWLDVFKFLGILGIVMGHISTNNLVIDVMYSVYVPLFFFASGWQYKPKRIIDDIKRRAFTTLLPYFIFGTITLIYYNVFEKNYREISLSLNDTIFGLFSGIFNYLEFNSPLWFLPCFFITSIIYNIMYNKTNKTITYIFCAVLYTLYSILQPLPHMPYSLNRMLELMIFYAIGNIMADNLIDKWLSELSIFSKTIIIILCFSICISITYFRLYHGFLLVLCGASGIISLMLLSIILENVTILSHIGRTTLLIMLIHGPIYRVLVKITSIIISCDTYTVRENLILSFLLSLTTIAISVICHIILTKIAPWSIGINNKDSAIKVR